MTSDVQPVEAPSHGPADYLCAALPGLFRPGVATLTIGAAILAGACLAMALGWEMHGKLRSALVMTALLSWAHGAIWTTTGEVTRLDTGLTDLAGATWGVFLALWGLPLWLGWVLLAM